MEENKTSTSIATSVLFGAVGAFAALLVAVFAGYIILDFSFLPAASCGGNDDYVYCFFDKNWDSGTYLSVITEFYSTIITVLMGLLGTVAAFAFFAIRGSAFQRAEETIEKEVERYIDTDKAKDIIHRSLETIENVELDKINLRLDEIEVALEEAEIPINRKLGREDEKETEKAN